MAEFTPGPWEWDQGDIGHDFCKPYCDVYVDDGNTIIAEVNDRISLETGRANARLIAAAPDMYAALEKAIEWDSHDDEGVPALWLQDARAALAKARGE